LLVGDMSCARVPAMHQGCMLARMLMLLMMFMMHACKSIMCDDGQTCTGCSSKATVLHVGKQETVAGG
jgi:hypothetical protein